MKILVASGPTREPLDPVRFLSNYSTGAMGRHLVRAASRRRHKVFWVECPEHAQTARELETKLRALLPKADAFFMAAAVCDARPASVSRSKIKKSRLSAIRLVKNPDILAGLARRKKKNQVFVGFALESENILANGREKLRRKGLDLLVLQKVSGKSSPFGDKPIAAEILRKDGSRRHFRAVGKAKLSEFLIRDAEKLKGALPLSEKRD